MQYIPYRQAAYRARVGLAISAVVTCTLCACGGGSADQELDQSTSQQSPRVRTLSENISPDKSIFLFHFDSSMSLKDEISQLGIRQSQDPESASVVAVLVRDLNAEDIARLKLWLNEGKVILTVAAEGVKGAENVARLQAELAGSAVASRVAIIVKNATGDDAVVMPYSLENKAEALSFALSL